MLTSKTFIKKTKKGAVLKVVREHYLRDDITCGSAACVECEQEDKPLEASPGNASKIVPNPHYIIPDTNVVIQQINVLEDSTIKNVIFLQTVLEEVRHRSQPAYKRARDLLTNSDRHYYAFTNEHHKDTYVERLPGESANDRNDRAIRHAVTWYQKHVGSDISILLLTHDRANLDKAKAENLLVLTVRDYVMSLNDSPELVDKLSQVSNEQKEIDNSRVIFPEHLAPHEMHSRIKAGTLKQGSFKPSRENYLEGYVNVEGMDEMVLIQGRSNLNRAVQDDVVAIELFSKERWSAPSELILADEEETEVEGEKHQKLLEAERHRKDRASSKPTARVVGIIKRKWRQYCGMLKPGLQNEARMHIFIPHEKSIPRIRIQTRQAETLASQRIVVAIDSWPRDSRYPLGHFVRSLGQVGDKDTENEVLLLEHDVPHHEFSESVLSFLPKMPWLITPEDEKKRVNLRDLYICSVDPPGCTDIDDALHCRLLNNGNYEVGVHIADVTHFIRPGTALDDEAASRSTTVYLVDKRIDMVPDLLSSNLCSLRSNVDRFAFSCIWEMTPQAEVLNVKFHKSIIKSKASLTYGEAQMMIDDDTKEDELTLGLRQLNSLAKLLKQQRLDKGALVLASPEVRFSMDSETHDPIDVETKQLRETNSMVEEFMLLANIYVARKIFQEFPECAVLRRHPAPPLSNFDPLIKAAASRGFDISVDSGKALAESLDKAEDPNNHYYNTMLRILATRCMMQAVYFCSGTIAEAEFSHYGLAAEIYTHFTSPIRRYADVLVHRLLAACIGSDTTYPELLDKKYTQSLCNNMNYRHKMAQYAGRASVQLHAQLFFKNRVQDEEGYVLFVRQNALQVMVPRYGLETSIFLDQTKFKFNQTEPSQTCDDVKFHLFDRVVVQLSIDRTNLQNQKLVMKLVEPKISGFSVEPIKRKASDDDDNDKLPTPPSKKKSRPSV